MRRDFAVLLKLADRHAYASLENGLGTLDLPIGFRLKVGPPRSHYLKAKFLNHSCPDPIEEQTQAIGPVGLYERCQA